MPVDSSAAKLRLAVRGVGQVAVSHVALSNGEETRRSRASRIKKILGRRAPTRELPAIDWAMNQACLPVAIA